jgi:hypothetical protein
MNRNFIVIISESRDELEKNAYRDKESKSSVPLVGMENQATFKTNMLVARRWGSS